MLILTRLALLYWRDKEQLNQLNRRGTNPYARWCDRESPRGPTYVDFHDGFVQWMTVGEWVFEEFCDEIIVDFCRFSLIAS